MQIYLSSIINGNSNNTNFWFWTNCKIGISNNEIQEDDEGSSYEHEPILYWAQIF